MSMSDVEPLVSVVVPVYNVEKYLNKTVDSLLAQTLENIEIILVDDGSTDSSGKLCDEYQEQERIVVVHKKNGGLSDARNAGVAVAKAKYVGFVDSDDYVENDMYELLYNNIVREEADVAFCGIYDVYATGTKPAYNNDGKVFTTDAKKAVEIVMHGVISSVSAVNKLYRKDILVKHPFLVGKTSEDAHFQIPYLCDIKKAVFDMQPKYYYIHREGTITTRPFKASDMSIIEAYTNNKRIIEEKFPDLLELAEFRYYWSLFYVLDKMFRSKSFGDNNEYKEVSGTIKKNYRKIMRNQYVGRARKIAVTGLKIHRKLYELCLRKYLKKRKQTVAD